MTRALIASILALALAGCASQRQEPPKPASPTQAQAGTTFGDFMTSYGSTSAPVPPLEAGRKVNEQDCTQGIDFTAGNLRCR